MPSGASPSLGSWLSLNITLGCLGHTQYQSLATPYSIVHRIFTQNLKTPQHKTQQKTHKLRQYKKIKSPLRYCNELILNSYLCNIYCIPISLWFIPSDTTHRFIKNKQTTHRKQNLSKTEQSVVIWIKRILMELIKFSTKFMDLRNLSINHLQKGLTKQHFPIKNGSNSPEC